MSPAARTAMTVVISMTAALAVLGQMLQPHSWVLVRAQHVAYQAGDVVNHVIFWFTRLV